MAAAVKSDRAAAPPAAKGVFLLRIFPFLLATNIFIGVYIFAKTYKRDQEKKNAEIAAAAATAASVSSPAIATAKIAEPTQPTRVIPSISDDEQRQFYKWMLEEKQKIKPHNAADEN